MQPSSPRQNKSLSLCTGDNTNKSLPIFFSHQRQHKRIDGQFSNFRIYMSLKPHSNSLEYHQKLLPKDPENMRPYLLATKQFTTR